MKYYLLKFEGTYSDEFEVYGSKVFDENQYEEFVKHINDCNYPQECWFGTNEGIEFYSKNHYLEMVDVAEISEEQADIVKKLFGDKYGNFLIPENEDEDEDI